MKLKNAKEEAYAKHANGLAAKKRKKKRNLTCCWNQPTVIKRVVSCPVNPVKNSRYGMTTAAKRKDKVVATTGIAKTKRDQETRSSNKRDQEMRSSKSDIMNVTKRAVSCPVKRNHNDTTATAKHRDKVAATTGITKTKRDQDTGSKANQGS